MAKRLTAIAWCSLTGKKCAPVPTCNKYVTTGGCICAISRLLVEAKEVE